MSIIKTLDSGPRLVDSIRVLQLSRYLDSERGGGIYTYVQALSRAACSPGVSFRYASLVSAPGAGSNRDLAWAGDPALPKWRNAILLMKWLPSELQRSDVVHIHGVTDWHCVVAALWCVRAKIPFILTVHGGLYQQFLTLKLSRRIKAAIYKRLVLIHLLRRAYTVIALSESEKKVLWDIDRNIDIRVIPPAVDLPEQPREHAEPGGSPLRVIFLGRIVPIKSLDTLLLAIHQLRKDNVDVVLDVVGLGSPGFIDELRNMADRLGVASDVVWHGFAGVSQRTELIRKASVAVLPSLSENFGFFAAEAMAEGVPVIVSDGVGLADLVRRDGAGSVFRARDSQGLAVALSEYLDVSVQNERGNRAFQCAVREFSAQVMGEQFRDLYRQAAPSGRGCA